MEDELDLDITKKWRRDIKTSIIVERGITLLAQAGPGPAARYFQQTNVPISVAVRVLAGKPLRTPSP